MDTQEVTSTQSTNSLYFPFSFLFLKMNREYILDDTWIVFYLRSFLGYLLYDLQL